MPDRDEAAMGIGPLGASWTEAERRLYPLATSDPSAYERAVHLARAVADRLGGLDLDGLAARWAERADIVAQASEATGFSSPLPADVIAGAGFSLRRTEAAAEASRATNRRVIDAARAAGDAWVTLTERGNLDAGAADPFHAVEMEIGSGLALVRSAAPDQVGSATFSAMVIALDPETGDVVDLDPEVAEPVESTTPDDHREAAARLRIAVEEHVRSDIDSFRS